MSKTSRIGPFRVARVYAPPSPKDGYRVLVDGLWPRGVAKQDLAADGWVQGVAPSAPLRKWFGHDPQRFQEFARKYRAELSGERQQAALDTLREQRRHGPVTLLTAAREPQVSHVAVLCEVLAEDG